MKLKNIISGLSVLVLCLGVKESKSSDVFDHNKIKELILENFSDHNFPSVKKKFESGFQNFEVNLQDKNLGNEGIKTLVEKIMIDPYQKEIQILNVRNNDIEVSGAISLSHGLEYLKGLKELDITHNPMNLLGLQTIFIKASTLQNLEKIRYTGQIIDNEELKKLFKGQIEPVEKENFIAFFKRQNHD